MINTMKQLALGSNKNTNINVLGPENNVRKSIKNRSIEIVQKVRKGIAENKNIDRSHRIGTKEDTKKRSTSTENIEMIDNR